MADPKVRQQNRRFKRIAGFHIYDPSQQLWRPQSVPPQLALLAEMV
jgi:hypothetical protein